MKSGREQEERRRGEETRRGEEKRGEEEEEKEDEKREEKEEDEDEEDEEEATDIKSNNPHLAGGEKHTHTRNLLHKKCFYAERLSNTQSVAETFTHIFYKQVLSHA